MAKKISDLPEATNIETDDIVWVDKYENGQLKSKRFKLLSIFSKLKTVFGSSLFGSGDIDSPKDGKAYGRKDGEWLQILENLEGLNTDNLAEGDDNKYFPTGAASKLETIEAGAQKNVQADWSETNQGADSFIQNKPNVLALGETSTSAYRGDRGATAFAHTQVQSGNPHKVTLRDVLHENNSTDGFHINLEGDSVIRQGFSSIGINGGALVLSPELTIRLLGGIVRQTNYIESTNYVCKVADYLIIKQSSGTVTLRSSDPSHLQPARGQEYVIYAGVNCTVKTVGMGSDQFIGYGGNSIDLDVDECITVVYSGSDWFITSHK